MIRIEMAMMERRFSTAVVCSMIICRAITNMRTSNIVSFRGLHKSLKNVLETDTAEKEDIKLNCS